MAQTAKTFTRATNTNKLKLAAHNGTLWKDLGNGGTTGNLTTGTIKTAAAATVYGYYTLATTDTFGCVKCDAGEDKIINSVPYVVIGKSLVENGFVCNWTPSSIISENSAPVYFVGPNEITIYKLTTTKLQNCVAIDNVEVFVFPRPPLPPFNHNCNIPNSN